ncbi:hypothetical protein KC330_g8460 [Hortaea werneckii]|nr:hypothetical protein KC330_g8460 [Hortaea werneckii]
MSRKTANRSIVTLKVDPHKLSALLRGAHSNPATPGNANEVRIKNEVGPDKMAAACGTMRKASRPEVLLELKTTTSPVIDLTDETPHSLGGSVQSAAAGDAERAATVPPTPVSLVQNLTPTASVGGQSSSQIHSVQPGGLEQDTIAVFPTRLEKLMADSLGAVVGGEASHANVVDASEEQSNEPRRTDLEVCMPRRIVGTANNDEDEDLYSSTPPPPNVHSRDTTQPTATAQMLQPEPLDDRERPRENDDSREQGVHHADQTRLRGATEQLASPVSTGAESRHRVASQVADESRDTDDSDEANSAAVFV